MSLSLPFSAAGRLPALGDNVAIAIRVLDAGTEIEIEGVSRKLKQTILEGHRFAVKSIAPLEPLLSWGLPFGHAVVSIQPGDYVCNRSMLDALAVRRLPFSLPAEPNFVDHLVPFAFDEAKFRAAPPVPLLAQPGTFLGYRRTGRRGVGTRNYLVILGTTSRTASFARQLAARLQPLARINPSLDGIVAIAHTEGGAATEPNNAKEILRALAGFLVHPNVGAVLAVDYGVEPINNARLSAFMREHGYPLNDVPHEFLSIQSGLAAALEQGEKIARSWAGKVATQPRTPEPLSGLRIALQCGGSDAFSGVSGNPLAGAIVHEVVRHGGIGVLCETDELSGAESYLVKNLRDADTARAMLSRIEQFRTRLGWHGVSAESNPSAGNKFRGLYNITLKSLGAVHKKDPRTRVDHVIDYAEPVDAPGFYFMDSPGNDLESIAGQVGAGCNLFLFATGNGSITNFPFVPTLKITTTTRRHQLLSHEMDINAGRYLDGEMMDALAAESFGLVVETASGKRTRGELAGHSQASLWRNWRQTDTSRLMEIRSRQVPDCHPLPVAFGRDTAMTADGTLTAYASGDKFATARLGLVLPTSMCSAQIARLAAERMNAKGLAESLGFERFVALPHSDGCGFGGETMYQSLHRTFRGYATHPNVAAALLLEHGCEKIPNDAMRGQFDKAGLPLDRFGWASVQLDGGIDKTLEKVENWFVDRSRERTAPARLPAGLEALTLGLLSAGVPGASSAKAFAQVARAILAAGGSVVLPEGDPLLARPEFCEALLGTVRPHATLAYGQPFAEPGLHLMQTDSDHWVENLTGLGAAGVHVFLGLAGNSSQQGHPMLPVLQVAERGTLPEGATKDIDAILQGEIAEDAAMLLRRVVETARGDYLPSANAGGFVDFQFARGLLGVST